MGAVPNPKGKPRIRKNPFESAAIREIVWLGKKSSCLWYAPSVFNPCEVVITKKMLVFRSYP